MCDILRKAQNLRKICYREMTTEVKIAQLDKKHTEGVRPIAVSYNHSQMLRTNSGWGSHVL